MPPKKPNFTAFYSEFKDKIYTYLLYRVGFNQALAEDLTSEVFIKAFKNFSSFDSDKSFQPWIFTIARNHLINHYRADKQIIPLADVEQTLSVKSKDVGRVLEAEQVIKIINTMEEGDKELLIMRYVDELNNKEMAAVLNKEEGAIRTQLSRSLAKLRALLIN